MHAQTSAQTQPHHDPEVIELRDAAPLVAWEEYHASGMPELINSFHLSVVLHECSRVGLASRLSMTPESAETLLEGYELEIGSNLLRYLCVKGIVACDGDRYRLTARGSLLFSETSLAMLGFYVGAYGPVSASAADQLTGKATYGKDVERDLEALGRNSGTLFHTFHTPTVSAALQGMGATFLLDLGCGGGRLLVDACSEDSLLHGIGIDISPAAIEVARELAQEAGVDDRLSFFVADAFDPSTWPDECAQADTLAAVGLLHEHFRDGEAAVIQLLNLYPSLLRDGMRGFLLGEPELRYDDRENDSEFFLAHVLTAQGFPRNLQQWLALIERSELRTRRIFVRPRAGQRLVFLDLVPK